jgi:ketosteroid isomerase-like protein
LVGCSPLLARWSTYRIRGYGWEAAERCAAFALRLEWLVVSGSLSQEDIDHIREGYRLFEDGDPAFLDRFTPDAALVFPETLPKGGTYASPWEALEYFNTIGELFEAPHPEPEEFIRDGDRVVALGHFHGRSRATSEQVVIRFAHVYRLTGVEGPVSQQRYTAFELFIDTAAVVAAITRTPGHRQASRVTDPGPGVR